MQLPVAFMCSRVTSFILFQCSLLSACSMRAVLCSSCISIIVSDRIYLELMHDYKLAEEYCDGIYQESNSTSLHGMHQLPASLQSRLKGVVSQGWGGPGGPGSDIYLLLIKVLTEQQPCLVLPEPTRHNLAKCVLVLCKLTCLPEI